VLRAGEDLAPRDAIRHLLGSGEAAAAAFAGLSLLLLRPALLGNPLAPLGLAGIYVALGAVSLAATDQATSPTRVANRHGGRARAPLPMVLGIGIGAVAVAAFLPGARPAAHLMVLTPAAILLNSLAAVSEEAFFRRFLYGRLERHGVAVAVGASALTFALIHVPIYGTSIFWLDLGAGLLFGWQRWASGRWEPSAATHVAANLLVVIR
jgi:membrane protease YdiL (CAAX protease family)